MIAAIAAIEESLARDGLVLRYDPDWGRQHRRPVEVRSEVPVDWRLRPGAPTAPLSRSGVEGVEDRGGQVNRSGPRPVAWP
ncbi:hypothetical protein [Auraticoccus monumenti]|uniref:Uncharacterized protein n=1 Tax=Auraticoccus monumenti TaxID=675864 RepID=A0A1G6ZF82_9ACTN|nr:hypothetical protein [Auraticoccus monumenti]SDE01319.1 hypothetical protein SAMN04489747_2277 [Auraticoccus monumenti]